MAPEGRDGTGRHGEGVPPVKAGADGEREKQADGVDGVDRVDRVDGVDGVGRVALALLGGLLVAGNLLTAWLLLKSFLVRPPDGHWDQESVTAAGVPAMCAHIGSWLTDWGTAHLVRWGLLRPWWYAVPIAVGVVSLVRMLMLTGR
ncbi:hypothetical protein PUR61_06985 [Streptomyces sp. BE20]|uniref:hypothetical protein n=1 Tax=Streptomyces sp. BE20 TaxID=3002525 RepID=UPI002E766F32|nr:hypothetical protein [Streptomyces sp. BE20]MEE1821937.1 hypothetical protein [Streptomyces sp. BE20]